MSFPRANIVPMANGTAADSRIPYRGNEIDPNVRVSMAAVALLRMAALEMGTEELAKRILDSLDRIALVQSAGAPLVDDGC
jgi:hypothetical protein